ncbi:MAG: PAS domain S-box protein [Bacteroidetes bacterium]|nr:PAS domain S-box protein [Bacteroidota bacterium]
MQKRKSAKNTDITSPLTGYAYVEIIYDNDGAVSDYEVLNANTDFEYLTGTQIKKLLKKKASDIFPGNKELHSLLLGLFNNTSNTKQKTSDFYFSKKLNRKFQLDTYFMYDGFILFKIKDITESEKSEIALLKSEEQLRFALEGANDGIWDVMMDTGKVYMSPRGCRILGYEFEELPKIAKVWNDLVHPDDMPETVKRLEEHISGKAEVFEVEQRLKTKDGGWKWILTRGKVVERDSEGKPKRATGTHTDISERKKVEEDLKESERRFSLFFYNSFDAILLTSPDGGIISANPSACRMFQKTEEEICRGGRSKVVDINDPRLPVLVGSREKQGFINGELTFVKKDGTKFEGEFSSSIFKDKDGKNKTVMIIRDVTERKTAFEAAKKSAEELAQILKNMLNAFVVWDSVFDKNGNCVSFSFGMINDAYEKISGVKREDVIGRDVLDVWPYTEKEWIDTYREVALTGKPKVFEMYHEPTNGWYHCNAYRPTDSTDRICVVFDNISERIKREEEFRNLNRTYAVISQIGQMIVRVQNRNELFRKTCDICIEYGKFRMAWIGLIDDSSGVVKPVIWSGYENGYFSEIVNITINEDEKGRGPTGTCIRENRAVYCNDIDTNPMMKPWREFALARDFHSSIALPISLKGKIIGALTMYSSSPSFFDTKEVKLLEQIKDDISYALEYLETAEDKRVTDVLITESEEKYRTLVEISTDAIFLNVRDRIIYLNSAALKLFGADTMDELIGKSPIILYDHEDKDMIKRRIKKVLSLKGPAPLVEEKIRRLDGKLIDVEVSATPFILRGERAIQVIMRDISEKKQKEKELIEAKENAEEMNRLKSNFLANMSHELRTPMVAILGFTELLSQKSYDSEVKYMADYVNKGAHRLMNTLNMILDLSRIESSSIDLNTVITDLSEITKTTVELYRNEAERKSLTLITDLNNEVFSDIDPTLFEKILDNLIQNAIIYTKKGSIEISTGYETIDDMNYSFVKIADTGIGIPDDKTKMIFEPFRQVSEGLSRKYEGTGLGLSITKRYVELMNGTITVSSRLGVGSVFTVRFKPAVKAATNTEAEIFPDSEAPVTGNENGRILLVEDDDLNAIMMGAYLKTIGQYDHVFSGEDAVEIVKKNKYTLILMDIGLKQMNGIEAMKEIRKIKNYEKIPVVAVTAFAMTGDREKLLGYGFDAYLSKPFSSEEIFSVIKKYNKA